MSLDRTKVLEQAQKHLAKGSYDKAIAEYQKLVKEDPKDVRTLLKIGDLYTRKGARKEAVETYSRVAEQYAQQGFYLKAVAVYKQILKLDPGRLDVSLRLADMYEQLQLVSDALATYEMVAEQYGRAGDVDKALATLGKMCDLDPDNIPVRIKYAEALSKASKTKEAAAAFEIGARLLKEQGRIDDYVKVAERLLFHRADDAKVARELAQIYVEKNDAKRALPKLQLCFKADPHDVATLELLARAFHMLGQTPKTVSVYKEIARIHLAANRHDERARILKRILELDPSDADARQALAGYAPQSVRPAPVVEPPKSAIIESAPPPEITTSEAEEDEDDLEMIEPDDDDIVMLDEDALEADADEEAPAWTDDTEGALPGDELIAQREAAKAAPVEVSEPTPDPDIDIEPPRPASARPPASAKPGSVRPSLRPSAPPDVANEAQIARLLTECDVFARYGLRNKVVDQLHRVLALDPNHVEARERLKDLYVDMGRVADAVEQLHALATLFEHDKPQVAQLYLKQIVELDPDSRDALARLEAVTAAAGKEGSVTDPESAGGDDEVMFVEDEATVDDTGMLRPVLVREKALAPISPEEFEAAPLQAVPTDEARAAHRASLPPGEIEEILDEAEFFLAQGLYEEARGTLRDALGRHREHPLLKEKLNEILDAASSAAGSRAPAAGAGEEDDAFMLAEKLAEELGPEPDTTAGSDVLDVEAVFAQFKKGVEQQVGLEDTDTHFDLGIAYKEMGLLDDAIHEFELAMANPQKECIAHTMIGLCFIEKGSIADAISHFKKGLYADAKTEREELGLYFELGTAYELLHDPKEALYYYQKVQKRDPTFRSVNDKIKALTDPRPDTKETAAAPSIDDVDRAFDDLMGED